MRTDKYRTNKQLILHFKYYLFVKRILNNLLPTFYTNDFFLYVICLQNTFYRQPVKILSTSLHWVNQKYLQPIQMSRYLLLEPKSSLASNHSTRLQTLKPKSLEHHRKIASLSVFYQIHFGESTSELPNPNNLPLSHQQGHGIMPSWQIFHSRARSLVVIVRTAKVWDSLPALFPEFPDRYNLSVFKSRMNLSLTGKRVCLLDASSLNIRKAVANSRFSFTLFLDSPCNCLSERLQTSNRTYP